MATRIKTIDAETISFEGRLFVMAEPFDMKNAEAKKLRDNLLFYGYDVYLRKTNQWRCTVYKSKEIVLPLGTTMRTLAASKMQKKGLTY